MRRFGSFSLGSACALLLLFGTPWAAAQQFDDDEDNQGEEDEEDEEDPSEDEDKDKDKDEGEDDDDDDGKTPEQDEDATDPDKKDESSDGESDSGTKSGEGDAESKQADEDASPIADEGECSGDDCTKRAGQEAKIRASSSKKAEAESQGSTDSDAFAPTADEARTEEAARAALTDFPDDRPSLTPFTVTTSTFSRLEIRDGYDRLGVETERRLEGDAVFYRARLGFETNPLPVADGSDVSVIMSPQATGVWGETGTIAHPSLGIYEGHIRFRSQRLDTFIGRQMLAYGEGIIFGAVDWHHVGRAYDGLKFRYKMNEGYLDMFAVQAAEVHPAGEERLFGGDEYVWGVYSGFGGYVGDDIETDAYVVGRSTVAHDGFTDPVTGDVVNAEGGTLMTAGARVKHKIDWFDYRFEAGVQFGEAARSFRGSATTLESPSAFAYQATGEFGFSFGAATRISVGGDFASGDDPTTRRIEGWDPLFATFWGWLGNMDVIGQRTNVASGNVKLTRGLTPGLTLNIDGHVFARPQDGGLGQVGANDLAGMEIDTKLKQDLGKYAYVRGTYGLFIPESGHYASDDIASYGEVELRLEF